MNSGNSGRRFELPEDLREEWMRIESRMQKLVYIPRFLVTSSRQIARLEEGATGEALPGVVLSSLCENIRRSGTYQAALYFSAAQLYSSKLEASSELRIRNMLRWFTPLEILSIMLMVYFNRYLSMRCPEDTWSRINPQLRRDMALGRKVGLAWDGISPGQGMLIAGMRRIAQGFLILANKKGDIPTRLINSGLSDSDYSDPDKERSICGYSHLAVAAYITQQCGLGVAMTSTLATEKIAANSSRDTEKGWHEARRILEQIKLGIPSDTVARESFLTEAEGRKTLDEYYNKLIGSNDVFSWINSEKEDVQRITDHTIVDISSAK